MAGSQPCAVNPPFHINSHSPALLSEASAAVVFSASLVPQHPGNPPTRSSPLAPQRLSLSPSSPSIGTPLGLPTGKAPFDASTSRGSPTREFPRLPPAQSPPGVPRRRHSPALPIEACLSASPLTALLRRPNFSSSAPGLHPEHSRTQGLGPRILALPRAYHSFGPALALARTGTDTPMSFTVEETMTRVCVPRISQESRTAPFFATTAPASSQGRAPTSSHWAVADTSAPANAARSAIASSLARVEASAPYAPITSAKNTAAAHTPTVRIVPDPSSLLLLLNELKALPPKSPPEGEETESPPEGGGAQVGGSGGMHHFMPFSFMLFSVWCDKHDSPAAALAPLNVLALNTSSFLQGSHFTRMFCNAGACPPPLP